jgi:DNA polymerase III delta subunit
MLKDYVYSITEGVAHKDLDWLMQLCGTNYARLQQELDKVSLFREDERRYLFDDLIRDGAVDDLSSYSIFNFTNAITSKDLTAIKSVYKELSRMDVNEFGLLTILLKNFKNIIMVQLNANPTPENTGLDGKQLYAIKKIPRVYSATQLVDIYTMLLDIDRQIKSGELPTDILIDYLVTKILSV